MDDDAGAEAVAGDEGLDVLEHGGAGGGVSGRHCKFIKLRRDLCNLPVNLENDFKIDQ